MTDALERAHEVATADGLTLHALVAAPPSPRGVLVLCHGITTNRDEHGQFPALRDSGLRAGFGVVRFDFRAHGRSQGTNEQLTMAGYRADADAIIGLVDEQFDRALPTIPVGISFGGAAAVHMANSHRPCAGLVLWYAVVDYRANFGEESPVEFTKMMRAAASDDDPAWAAMPILGTPYYLPQALMDELPDEPTPARLRALGAPLLAYYGSRDKLVAIEPLRRIAAERPDFDLRIAHGAAHGFILWRPWVIKRTVEWASQRVAGP